MLESRRQPVAEDLQGRERVGARRLLLIAHARYAQHRADTGKGDIGKIATAASISAARGVGSCADHGARCLRASHSERVGVVLFYEAYRTCSQPLSSEESAIRARVAEIDLGDFASMLSEQNLAGVLRSSWRPQSVLPEISASPPLVLKVG
jgi:hypothetical protein